VLASLAAAVLFAAAACGGGGDGDEADEAAGGETSEASEAVPASQWLGDFCTALGTWQGELTEGVPDTASVTDVETAKESLVSYLENAAAATQTLVDDIQAAGVPEVENGEAIATEMRNEIAAVGESFSAAKADVEGLSTDDPAAFATSLSELGTTLTEAGTAAGTAFDELAEKYPAAELDAAATEVEACQNVFG
jgi:hypothetical protein